MLPRLGSSSLVTTWILLAIATTIIAAADGGFLAGWLALEPHHIWRGQVWRLVTWPMIEPGPVPLLFTCFAIYRFGGDLAGRWGDARLRRFMLQVIVATGVLVCIVATLAGAGHLQRLGGWATADVLVIAWARQFPDRELTMYGVNLSNGTLVTATVGSAIVFGLMYGLVLMSPELIACVVAAMYPVGWLRR